MNRIEPELVKYVEENIIPRYDSFDAAHQRNHAECVIKESLELAKHYDVDVNMVYAIAAYHDTGLCDGREHHHEASARIIRSDEALDRWFTRSQIDIMADAAEDHRASSKHEPRTIYGRIVAEADRLIDPITIIRRTVQYGLAHYPELNLEQQFDRCIEHMHEKYHYGGYLRLWIPESDNAARLEELRSLIDREEELRNIFNEIIKEETR